MPFQDLIDAIKTTPRKSTAEIKHLIRIATQKEVKREESFYECLKTFADYHYEEAGIFFSQHCGYTATDGHLFQGPYEKEEFIQYLLRKKKFAFALYLIQTHVKSGGRITDYEKTNRRENGCLLHQVLIRTRYTHPYDMTPQNEKAYDELTDFIVAQGGATPFIADYSEKSISPYYLRHHHLTRLNSLKILEKHGIPYTAQDVFSYYPFEESNFKDSVSGLIPSIDEEVLVYLYQRCFLPQTHQSRIPGAAKISPGYHQALLQSALSKNALLLAETILSGNHCDVSALTVTDFCNCSEDMLSLLQKKGVNFNKSLKDGEKTLGEKILEKMYRDREYFPLLSLLALLPSNMNKLKILNWLLQTGVTTSNTELTAYYKSDPVFLLQHGLYHFFFAAYPPVTLEQQRYCRILTSDEKLASPSSSSCAVEYKGEIKASLELAHEFIKTRLAVQTDFSPRAEEKDKDIFSGLTDKEGWMLCEDGEKINEGPFEYDSRELGCIPAIRNTYDDMLTSCLDKPITADTLRKLHQRVTYRVANLNSPDIGGKFRTNRVYFVLASEATTPTGIAEIKSMIADGAKFSLHKTRDMNDITQLSIGTISPPDGESDTFTENEANNILNHCHHTLRTIKALKLSPTEQDEKCLETIAECVMRLERTHLFNDANCRLLMLVLNLLLLQNNFKPSLLRNPNCMDGFDVKAWVKEIKQGMLDLQFLKANKRYPGLPSVDTIIQKSYLKNNGQMSLEQGHVYENNEKTQEYRKTRIPYLHWAIYFNYPHIADTLLEMKEMDRDINRRDSRGNSALMIAVGNNNMDRVKKLISHRADIHLVREDTLTAYDIAKLKGYTEVCELLLSHGATAKPDTFYATYTAHVSVGYDHLCGPSTTALPPLPSLSRPASNSSSSHGFFEAKESKESAPSVSSVSVTERMTRGC